MDKIPGEKLPVFYTDLGNIRVEQNVTASAEDPVHADGEDDSDISDDDFVVSDSELEDDDDDHISISHDAPC